MNILALDTATSVLSVALKKGRHRTVQKKIGGFLTHAENLLPAVDSLLKEEKIRIDDVDIFLIDRGPGSFTGLRVGYATLKGFFAAKKKDCYGGLSLDMIAAGCELPVGSNLAVCVNAFRQKIYARFYQNKKGVLAAAGKPRVLGFEELASCVPAGIYLTGDALVRYRKNFEELCRIKKGRILPEAFWYPAASAMINAFTGSLRNPRCRNLFRKLEKPGDFLPLYFRLSEAEEKRSTLKG